MRAYVWSASGPAGPLEGLWHIANCRWPDDERIRAMLDAAGVPEGDYLAELLTKPEWGPDPKVDLLARPSFDQLVLDHPETLRAKLAVPANDVERIAGALLAASPEALAQYAEPIAGLAADKSRKRRATGTMLADPHRVRGDGAAPAPPRRARGSRPSGPKPSGSSGTWPAMRIGRRSSRSAGPTVPTIVRPAFRTRSASSARRRCSPRSVTMLPGSGSPWSDGCWPMPMRRRRSGCDELPTCSRSTAASPDDFRLWDLGMTLDPFPGRLQRRRCRRRGE